MIVPSIFLLALSGSTLATPNRHSEFHKRAVNAIAAAASRLNASVAYQICIVAQGSFSAVALLGGKNVQLNCESINPNAPPSTSLIGSISTDGCLHYVPQSYIPSYFNSTTNVTTPAQPAVSKIPCPPTYLSNDGHGLSIGNIDTAYFTIPSINSTCEGVNPTFNLGGISPATTFSNNNFIINCTSGQISFSNPNTTLCVGEDSTSSYFFSSYNNAACNTSIVLHFLPKLTPSM